MDRRLHIRIRNDRHIVTMHYSVDGAHWIRYDRGMEVSGYHHNVAYEFLSLRPAIYAAGTGEVRFRNFTYRALRAQPRRDPRPWSQVIQERTIAVDQPGPHDGGGSTTAFPFFADVKDLPLVFRKRVLKPGSGIGHHEQLVDEIYYVLSGTGELTLDGVRHRVGSGTAILTRPGSSHSLRQTGRDNLVIIIAYPQEPAR